MGGNFIIRFVYKDSIYHSSYIHAYMHVCMCECMYVCMHPFMMYIYVRMYESNNAHRNTL